MADDNNKDDEKKPVKKKKASSKKKAVAAKKPPPKQASASAFRPTPVKKKSGGKKDDKLEVKGFTEDVAEMRRIASEVESLKTESEQIEERVIAHCKTERLAAEKDGRFHKTCKIGETDDQKAALVIFKDRYRDLSTDDEDQIRTALGDSFEGMVKRVFKAKPRKDVTLEQVQEALGEEAFETLSGLFDIEEALTLSGDFMERRSALRPQLPQDTNEFLDSLLEYSQYKPSINLK